MNHESRIPKFKTIAEEAEFWDTHSLVDYLGELEPVKPTFTRVKEKRALMSFRISRALKQEIEKAAKSYDVSPSSLVRLWMIEGLKNLKETPI
ncbi:hypothetical protein COY34_00645 [candidate division WWE3 bacterium CG_4_10_14_0_2_um_filter_42_8]|uniref:Uncharacterized protein n=1 Tax=candidate division WWE3 bacterium CG_4_10_14_0_2_um_filter_42_8 TaxID=1975074 RepID=A0A2M7TDJ9_UNCKA|nr:MAG: hypothetical protein COY34_00645 [candidate division WWE3 bacterium CG_4_10_14_0_2_um_filter_42_8]